MKPFLKWPGSKSRLLPQLVPLLPDMADVHTYVEPFLGSGALFFSLEFDEGDRVVLADCNAELIDCYKTLRDLPQALLVLLEGLAIGHADAELTGPDATRDFYNRQRDRFNRTRDLRMVQQSALFLYLNRTCFNGLWRVNKDGAFNVPLGDYTNPTIYNAELLHAAAKQLDTGYVRILCADFESAVAESKLAIDQARAQSAFVYFDPPYVPVSDTADFTGYTAEKFDESDLLRLRSCCDTLDKQNVKWMLSNSDTPSVHKLFKKYNFTEISRRGSINSDASKRGDVTELVIRNYT